jgi:hypothetical protein
MKPYISLTVVMGSSFAVNDKALYICSVDVQFVCLGLKILSDSVGGVGVFIHHHFQICDFYDFPITLKTRVFYTPAFKNVGV